MSNSTPPDGGRQGPHSAQPSRLLRPAGLSVREILPTRMRHHHVEGAKLVIHRLLAGSMHSYRGRWTPMHHREGFALFGGNKRAYYDVRDSLLGGGVI